MQFKSVFFALSALAAVVVAAPTEVTKREAGKIVPCTGYFLGGECVEISVDYDICYNLEGYLQDGIESMAIDGNIFCHLYKEFSCSGDLITASGNPGDQQPYALTLPDGWVDVISSFKCFPRA